MSIEGSIHRIKVSGVTLNFPDDIMKDPLKEFMGEDFNRLTREQKMESLIFNFRVKSDWNKQIPR